MEKTELKKILLKQVVSKEDYTDAKITDYISNDGMAWSCIINAMQEAYELGLSQSKQVKPLTVEDYTYYVNDVINHDFEAFKTFKEAKKYILDNFIEESEGIHPDIESINIYKCVEKIKVEVIDNEEDENYSIVIKESTEMQSKQVEVTKCSKCRTENPENCHSINCPMRFGENSNIHYNQNNLLPTQKGISEEDYTTKPQFWHRLKTFVENVQVNDQMSEEEKQMIIHIADNKFKELQPKQLGEETIEEIEFTISKFESTWLDKKTLINLALNEQMKMLSVCPEFIDGCEMGESTRELNPAYTQIKETITYLENLLK